MLYSPRRDLARLRDDLMACFRETRPSPRFHSALFLGLTWLHLAARNLEKTRDLNERRYWINEFTKGQKDNLPGDRSTQTKIGNPSNR